MTEWTEDKINEIVDIKSAGGHRVDIFNSCIMILLYSNDRERNYKPEGRIRDESFSILLEDFEDCKDEDDIKDVFIRKIRENVDSLMR